MTRRSGALALDDEVDGLAMLPGKVPHQPGQRAEHGRERIEPEAHDLLLDAFGDGRQEPRDVSRLPAEGLDLGDEPLGFRDDVRGRFVGEALARAEPLLLADDALQEPVEAAHEHAPPLLHGLEALNAHDELAGEPEQLVEPGHGDAHRLAEAECGQAAEPQLCRLASRPLRAPQVARRPARLGDRERAAGPPVERRRSRLEHRRGGPRRGSAATELRDHRVAPSCEVAGAGRRACAAGPRPGAALSIDAAFGFFWFSGSRRGCPPWHAPRGRSSAHDAREPLIVCAARKTVDELLLELLRTRSSS
jgi:hypothetical protein